MKKFSKFVASSLLAISLISTMSIAAFAWENIYYPEGGKHTYGVSQPGNGYEFGYSYYHHNSKSHGSKVYYNGRLEKDSGKYLPGYTSTATGSSIKSGATTFNFYYDFR